MIMKNEFKVQGHLTCNKTKTHLYPHFIKMKVHKFIGITLGQRVSLCKHFLV